MKLPVVNRFPPPTFHAVCVDLRETASDAGAIQARVTEWRDGRLWRQLYITPLPTIGDWIEVDPWWGEDGRGICPECNREHHRNGICATLIDWRG